jgi:hypothetical protein
MSLGFSLSDGAAAQSVQLINQFSFGTIAIRTNAAKERLVLNLNGTFTNSANILVISPPQRAEFLAVGFQPSTALSLSIVPIELSEDGQGNGKKFNVGFVYLSDISTDPTGSATILIGGTLETSGDGTPYSDRDYGGLAQLIVNY